MARSRGTLSTRRSRAHRFGGGLSAFKSKMGFWAGSLDLENSKWLDQSGNGNDADLVGGHCVNFINDVTLTMQDAKVGEIVAELNGSASDLSGVSVNGTGHIEIDQSALTNPKVWQVKLSDGTELRFTSGISDLIFYDGGYGTLGGTEDTDWEWSTTNDAFLNLQYGCSRYAFVNDTTKRSFGNARIYQTQEFGFELYWEGYLFETNANLCGIDLYPETYGYSLFYATGSRIVFANRETGTISPRYNNDDGDVTGGYVKVKVVYNGGGYDNLSSWKMYLNGEEKTLVDGGTDYTSRTAWDYAGHDNQAPKCLIKTHYVKRGEELWQAVYNGQHSLRYGDEPDGYIYIPATEETDWIGQSALNPAYTDSHNGCEVKVKLSEVTALQTADVYDYLFESGGSARELDLTQFYPNLNDVIQLNITGNRYKDFVVMTEAVDLYSYLAGLKPFTPLCSFRVDTAGQGDTDAPLDYLVAQEQNASFDAHCTIPIAIDSEYAELLTGDKLAIAIHEFNPAFWKYGTYEEGKYHYDNIATAGEIADGTVIENQGRIGYAYTGYNTPKYIIEALYTAFGKAYPGGTPPATDDNNEDWWEWVIQVYAEHIADNGGTLAGLTQLGAKPAGLGQINPEVKEILNQYIGTSSFEKGEIEASDALENSVSIFGGSEGASIVEDGGVNCQKLSGAGSVANGELVIGSDDSWKFARNIVVSFDVKQTAGTAIPFPEIFHGIGTVTSLIKPSGSDISIGGVAYTDVMATDTWYTIKIVWKDNYYYVYIFDESGTCLLKSDDYYSTLNRASRWVIIATNSDILIKNVSVYGDFYRDEYELMTNVSWESGYSSELFDDWVDARILSMIDTAYYGNRVAALFSHYVQNPETKDADGTETGVIQHRSYNGFSEIFTWLKANGFSSVNSRTAWNAIMSSAKRNLISNGDFIGTLNGYTKASSVPFGMVDLAIDATEASNSIDGTNIAKISSGDSVVIYFAIVEEGWYNLQFYIKGDITFYVSNGLLRDDHDTVSDSNEIVAASYELVKIPIYLNNCHDGTLVIKGQADSWIHKLLLHKI